MTVFNHGNAKRLTLSILAILISIGFICFADECLLSIRQSLKICALILIPSLFPFFVCSKIALKLGFSSRVGVIFDSTTRFLFNVPGCSMIAFLFSIFGGYPIGAKLITELYESKQCTKSEAERMLAFCNNSGLIFVMVTVGVSLYSTVAVGVILYISHTIGAIISGIIFRNHHSIPEHTPIITQTSKIALAQSSGEIITESIYESVISILTLCGFVVFFSLIISLINSIGMIEIVSRSLCFLKLPYDLTNGFVMGLFEITNGIYQIAYQQYNLPVQLCLTSFLISWSGLSIISQVAGVVYKHRFSLSVIILSKLIQSIVSTVITYVLYINFMHLIVPAIASISFIPSNSITNLDFIELLPIIFILVPIIFKLMSQPKQI